MAISRMWNLLATGVTVFAVASCASTAGGAAATATGADGAAVTAADQNGRRAPVWEQRFLTAARPNPQGVRLRVTVFETPIPGATRQEFSTNLRAKQDEFRGRRDGAQMPLSSRWNMRWNWQTVVRAPYCAFRTVNVFLDYQTHYVRLDGPVAQDPDAQTWWSENANRTFNRHLVHLKELRDAVGKTQQKLRDMQSMSCEQLTREANQVANRDLQAIADRLGHTLYDSPPGTEN
jgi:predicted secreted Zn-dependent protease